MVKKKLAIIALFFVTACQAVIESAPINTWQQIDFDVAMRTSEFPQSVAKTKALMGIDGTKVLAKFRTLF